MKTYLVELQVVKTVKVEILACNPSEAIIAASQNTVQQLGDVTVAKAKAVPTSVSEW